MIQALVFDLGGVLIDLCREDCIRAFRDILGYTRISEMIDDSHQKGLYMELEAGRISADAFRTAILKDSRPGATPEEVDRCMAAFLPGMDDAKARLVERLAGRWPLYILSNNNPISMARCHAIMEEHGLDWRNVFRDAFISSEMKVLKPERAFYDEVVRRIGLEPGSILFIDDSEANVRGARAAGLRAVRYTPGTDLGTCVENALKG